MGQIGIVKWSDVNEVSSRSKARPSDNLTTALIRLTCSIVLVTRLEDFENPVRAERYSVVVDLKSIKNMIKI